MNDLTQQSIATAALPVTYVLPTASPIIAALAVPLTAGPRVGSYQITAPIGVGGMGEVWCATDTNLGRQVAIKVLPDTFAHDAERLARLDYL